MDTFRSVNDLFTSVLDQIFTQSNTNTVFGVAQQHGEVTIIPVGEVSYRFRAGGGGGTSSSDVSPAGDGTVKVRPIGYIELSEGTANYVQFLDLRRIISLSLICSTLLAIFLSPAIRNLLVKTKQQRR